MENGKEPSKAESIAYFQRVHTYLQTVYKTLERIDRAATDTSDAGPEGWKWEASDIPSSDLLDTAGTIELIQWRLRALRDLMLDEARGECDLGSA